MLIHTLRIASAVFSGRFSAVRPGRYPGVTEPHVYRARAGLMDLDPNLHMNNAAYGAHCELARWHMASAIGLVPYMLRERVAFLATSTAFRFRREIPPYRPFEVRSWIAAADDSSILFLHNFHRPSGGPALATSLCSAKFRGRRGPVAPTTVLAGLGLDERLISSLDGARGGCLSDPGLLKSLGALEGAMREV